MDDKLVNMAALEAKGLVLHYADQAEPALAGFDIAIGRGEIFGLLGPNGAGKTTAISVLCTLLKPEQGTVTLFGVDVLDQPRRARELFGMVPQDIALYPELTVRENLNFFGRLFGLKRHELSARVDEALEFVGLAAKSGSMLGACSGGMKRRTNLAAGILARPKFLFLDEPTVGIDAQSRNLILEKLVELNKAGTTMLYTTHYMEEAEKLCATVAVMDNGRCLAVGSPKKLIADTPGVESLQDLFFSLTGKSLRD